VSYSTSSEIGSPASSCIDMTRVHIITAPNTTCQSFPETSLRHPASIEPPIGRIRPVQEAFNTMIQVYRNTAICVIPDALLLLLYRHLTGDAVLHKSSELRFHNLRHENRNRLGRYTQLKRLDFNLADTRTIMIKVATGWVFDKTWS
jgi:hypothetical protein